MALPRASMCKSMNCLSKISSERVGENLAFCSVSYIMEEKSSRLKIVMGSAPSVRPLAG